MSVEDLERLAEVKLKVTEQTLMHIISPIDSKDGKISLDDRMMFDEIINSIPDFLESLVSTKDELELYAVVERLAEVQMKLRSMRIHGLPKLKIAQLIESSESKMKAMVSAGYDLVVE